jgi:dTDP-4-amino-4,6-dideoxy-D-galactose acyltransferase
VVQTLAVVGSLGNPAVTSVCESLAWDTEHWGFLVARVRGPVLGPNTLPAVDFWCRANGIRCLYFLAREDDLESCSVAQCNGFRRVDERVTFAQTFDSPRQYDLPQISAEVRIRPSLLTDIPSLRRIARVSYHDSRFYFDDCFPRDRCDLLYETWVQRSCEGWAEVVLVATSSDRPIGFVSCHLDAIGATRLGRIGLIGVRSDCTGRGIGSNLVQDAIAWFQVHGASTVTVATQRRNLAAQGLYQRCGFTVSDVQVWYHKWYALAEG